MLQTILNVLLIILGFGVLIFIHELGHFIAAKWAGIRTEAFAVGMGPVAIAWRKGIGLRFGSTAGEYEARVRAFLSSDDIHKPPEPNAAVSEDLPRAQFYRIGDKLGLGETEYSLRWLPVGGFVKMLGQEDANPNAVSDDPRSYNMRPIGKRMIVVSAGVCMNLLLAIVLFVIAFTFGVRFPAAVVGDVANNLAAARTAPENGKALGIDAVGLQPGDKVLSIDGDRAETFADLQIASAMARPGAMLTLVVQRPGVPEPLTFKLQPEKDPLSGLLSIGVAPGASTTLISEKDDDDGILTRALERSGLAKQGVQAGMTLLTVDGQPVTAFGQVTQIARESLGRTLQTTWARVDEQGHQGPTAEAALTVAPDLEEYLQSVQHDAAPGSGLLGFTPLVRFVRVTDGSANAGIIKPGDVLVQLGDVPYPRTAQLFDILEKHRRQDVNIVVLREDQRVALTAHVNRKGKLLVEIEPADDVLITAQPVITHARYRTDDPGKTEEITTPVGRSNLFTIGGTRIVDVAGQPVSDWSQLRSALFSATADANTAGLAAKIDLQIEHPLAGSPREAVALELSPDEVKRLHALRWHIEWLGGAFPNGVFEPIFTVRQGSPMRAIAMGFDETRKMVLMTYLTIDRLFRGSVGVDQLRGPVGIVHIGTKVAREGMMYLLFFLGMISVNLAVINFLPLPIVDGGLFLFLIYEKFKGRPPPLGFQNAATVVGLLIIGTAFIVTFYNDVVRLLS